jgi:hypothetical protein
VSVTIRASLLLEYGGDECLSVHGPACGDVLDGLASRTSPPITPYGPRLIALDPLDRLTGPNRAAVAESGSPTAGLPLGQGGGAVSLGCNLCTMPGARRRTHPSGWGSRR